MSKPQKVLIVDDSKENLLIFSHIIKEIGVSVIETVSPQDALALIKRHHFFLFVLDVEMPDINGFELAKQIREEKKHSTTPIIFVSAVHTDCINMFEGYQLGAVDYLIKPVHPFILQSKVKTFLELFKAKLNAEQQAKKIEKTNKKLVDLNKRMQEFVAVVAHDLRSPLGSIYSFCDFLKEEDIEEEERSSMVNYVSDIARNSIYLVDELLDIVSISTGNIPLKKSNFKVNDLIEEVIQEVHYKLEPKNIHIDFTATQKHPSIFADSKRIRQVLNNLLINAIKFSHKNSHIKILVVLKQSSVCISVEDSGIGIPKSMIKDLFEKSKSCSRLGTDGEKGTGFGLPLSNEIIEKHDSELSVKSKEGAGSTFSFCLPLSES